MTVETEVIGGIVAEAGEELRLVGEPAPLGGGFWAQMWRVRVSGQPDGMPADVVVRHAPHRELGAKEAEVQRVVAAQGFRTPRIWLSCSHDDVDDPRADTVAEASPQVEPAAAAPTRSGLEHSGSHPAGGWWSVMDFAPGAPLLAGLDPASAFRRAPSLVRTLPRHLAGAMAGLHRLDPAPVTEAVRHRAPTVAWTLDELVEQYHLGAEAFERPDIAAALDQLMGRAPARSQPVVCHGDLHPFNVLADGDGLTVLDWTGALLADPCFDVAWTDLILGNPPLGVPRPLAGLVRRAGRLIGRRFVSAYAAANPRASLDGLGWFRALHSARIVIELAVRRAEHGADAGGHPFQLVAPAAARELSVATGTEVRPWT